MDYVLSGITQHRDRFIQELVEWLKIPSVSADPAFKNDVLHAAAYLKEQFEKAGMDNVELLPTAGYPVVYAEKITDASKPTVLVYGHYDVQPADPYELWTSPPFEPVIKTTELHPQGAIFARGACDDKGQVYMHVKALELMLSQQDLPCNIKVIIEGEEEIGSSHLGDFLKEYKEKLKADVILVSDTGIIDNETPSITNGLRGLCYMEVEVTGPNRDLHSGIYGGGVDNPLNVLCRLVGSLKDESGHITIAHFYDDVVELSAEEKAQINAGPVTVEDFEKSIGLPKSFGEQGYTLAEQLTIRPTLDVNGIWGGYTGEGAKTVLPAKAQAKISMRLVPNQSSEKIAEIFAQHFEKIAPPTVKVKVTPHHGGEPYVTPVDSVEFQAANKAMETTFGKKPLAMRNGASIPIVALFEEILGLKTVLMGFGLDSDAIHSPNEHYGLFNYFKGIETIPYFYQYYAELRQQA
ncbi:MAG: dipeptidase [Chitinophagales bacterium]|nr:dipeptidase [Chitinophagales bacterium]